MRRILLTGMSGTGKSSVVEAIGARGRRAIDLDQPGWSIHAEDGAWIWNEQRVWELLGADHDGPLFVSGCAENQRRFYSYFDRVVLLSAPTDLIVERLRTRTNNPYGKYPSELADVLRYVETVEPLIRRGCTHEIDTSVSLDEVVRQVLEIADVEPAV